MNELFCKQCNKKFYVQNYRLKTAKYCSCECKAKFESENPHTHKTSNGCHWEHTEETKKKLGETWKEKIALGYKQSEEAIERMRETMKIKMKGEGNNFYGKKHTKETKEKFRKAKLGIKQSKETIEKRASKMRGSDNYQWIKDRTQLKRYGDDAKDRRSYAYANWRNEVKKRDNFKCKINNKDCSGRLEVHHILGYTEYPELRYQLNNGITLCQAHHPRKRAEEKRLIPEFQELVSVLK